MDVLPWLTLKSVPGIGNHLFKRLIERFETPERVFAATEKELQRIKGISLALSAGLKGRAPTDTVKRDLELARKMGFHILPLTAPGYPPLLSELPDPPPLLYVHGKLHPSADRISVIGARAATNYGINAAQSISRGLSAMGLTVVSGMARGIDTAAHRGALSGGGRTVAVLGSGLGRIYPPENDRLFHEIAENGAVISEFPVLTPPEPHNFPRRNRIISGLSLGTVVVEAGKRSGSLITARLALEQGREVFAVPGSIRSFKSSGTHSLLKQGAKLTESAKDVAEELAFVFNSPPLNRVIKQDGENRRFDGLSRDETRVLDGLEPYPVHIDDIMRQLSIDPGRLSAVLLELELKGFVTQSPGKLFSISEE